MRAAVVTGRGCEGVARRVHVFAELFSLEIEVEDPFEVADRCHVEAFPAALREEG